MKMRVVISAGLLLFGCAHPSVPLDLNGYIEGGLDGRPLKYISGCELDLNDDGRQDVVLLFEIESKTDLMILTKTKEGYNVHVVARDMRSPYLSCKFGKSITETASGKGNREEAVAYRTSGAYVELEYPESSSVAYFWDGTEFKEIWTSD